MKLLRRWGRIIARSYIYRYVRRFLRRFFALVAVIVFLVDLGPRVQAVTPQQGWYISGQSRVGTIDYWVISNKRENTIGPFQIVGEITRFTDPIFDSPYVSSGGGNWDANDAVNWLYHPVQYWQGNSDIPWYIDIDWRIAINVTSVTSNYGSSALVYLIDRSKLTTWAYTDSSGMTNYFGGVDFIPSSYTSLMHSGIPFSPGSFSYFGAFQYEQIYQGFTPAYQIGGSIAVQPNIVNINDLVICAAPYASAVSSDHLPARTTVKLDVKFWCPKDKAPPGLEVGMSWPYVPTATVNAIEHFDPWKEELQKYSQIPSVSDIGNMNTRLNTAVEDAVKVDSAILPVIDELASVQEFPLFTLLVPLVLAFVILCVLIRRAIN